MQDERLPGLPPEISRRKILESMAGVAVAGALPSSMRAFEVSSIEQPATGDWARAIGDIHGVASSLGTYELCEFEVPVRVEGLEKLNPYRASELALDAEITLPSGRTMRVPGFYSEDFNAKGSAATPLDGSKGWRIRFSGPEAGAYNGKVELRVKGELVASRDLPPFTLSKSRDHGIVHISRTAPRHLEFDDGSGYFPIGQDVCWTTDVSKSIPGAKLAVPTLPWNEAFPRWFGRMGQSGANWARLFIKPNFYLEDGEPWAWNLESAWRLDKVLDLARKNGIYLCLCFNAERSDEGGAYHGSMDLFRASNTAWGRLLRSQGLAFDQFFLNPLCREMYRDKIRYFVARWGHSPNIFSWEFWNEIGTVEQRDGMGPWLREMTAYTRITDAWGHLIKSSTSDAWEPERWGAEVGDLNDVHPYFGWSGEEEPKNFGEFIPRWSAALYASGRPFIVGETGIAREFQTTFGLAGDMADKDVTCFHLHECLWGGLFAGAVGTGMAWWWDEHVDLHDGYFRFRAITNFVADINFTQENFARAAKSYSSTDDLRLLELAGKYTRLIWIRRTGLGWYSLAVENQVFAPVTAASATLTGMLPGTYRVEYWSPEEGKLLKTAEIVAKKSALDVPLPEVRSELALKVRQAGH